MAILEGIAAGKAALDVSKIIMDMVNRPDGNLADVRGKVSELLIHVVNAQVALGEARVEISELQTLLDDREALKALNNDMDFHVDGGFFIRKSETNKGLIAYWTCPHF